MTCAFRPSLHLVGADDPVRPICTPILFFLFWRKKRSAAPGEEKKENWWKPGSPYHTAIMWQLSCPVIFARPKSPLRWRRRAARYLDDGGQLSSGEYGKLKAISKIKKEFHVNTIYFTEPTTENIAAAADIIRRGGLLGIPTETVYGLGANALDEEAVLHIFEAKGRPQDNPLIIHVPDASWLERYCKDVPESAHRLAERFWPGPLTMILPRKPIVPLRTTGGLDTVGVRCPNHPITLDIIRAADVPIAAPSGNTSGRPSPTCLADMREDMDGKIDGVFDGGPCAVGVESTIIDLTVTPPRLLRPGGLPLEALEEVLGEVAVDKAVVSKLADGERPKAPGMKYRHYAPKAPVTVVTGDPAASAAYLRAHVGPGDGVICFSEFCGQFMDCAVHDLGPAGDKSEQARRVFDALREFDHEPVTAIWAQCPDAAGLGLAVSNRLKKAAGFHVIEV